MFTSPIEAASSGPHSAEQKTTSFRADNPRGKDLSAIEHIIALDIRGTLCTSISNVHLRITNTADRRAAPVERTVALTQGGIVSFFGLGADSDEAAALAAHILMPDESAPLLLRKGKYRIEILGIEQSEELIIIGGQQTLAYLQALQDNPSVYLALTTGDAEKDIQGFLSLLKRLTTPEGRAVSDPTYGVVADCIMSNQRLIHETGVTDADAYLTAKDSSFAPPIDLHTKADMFEALVNQISTAQGRPFNKDAFVTFDDALVQADAHMRIQAVKRKGFNTRSFVAVHEDGLNTDGVPTINQALATYCAVKGIALPFIPTPPVLAVRDICDQCFPIVSRAVQGAFAQSELRAADPSDNPKNPLLDDPAKKGCCIIM